MKQLLVLLEKLWLLLSEVLNSLHKLLPRLILQLLLWLAQNLREDRNKLAGQALDGRIAVLVETNDALVDWLVLLVVLLEWKDVDEDGENLADWHLISVSHDHAAHAAGCIVQGASKLGLEKWLEEREDLVVCWEVSGRVRGVGDQETSSVGSVGAGLWVRILEAVEEELKKLLSVRSNSRAHVMGTLSNNTNRRTPLKVLLGGSALHNSLLKDLPELAELWAEGNGEADDDVQSGVDDQPVVLGNLADFLGVLVVANVHLTWVLASDQGCEDGGDLLEHVTLGQDGWAAKAKGGGDVAVDVGDDVAVMC